jgi:hypothetical protein
MTALAALFTYAATRAGSAPIAKLLNEWSAIRISF